MTKNSGKQAEIEYRRNLVAKIYHTRAKYQSEIAEILEEEYKIKVDRATISRDLTALRKQWREETTREIKEVQAEMSAELDGLKLTYYEAWERSLEEFKTKTVKQKGAKIERTGENEETKITPVEATQKAEERNGDPRYLQGVQWCIDRKAKLLGADAPQKIAGPDGGAIPIKVIGGVNLDDI